LQGSPKGIAEGNPSTMIINHPVTAIAEIYSW